MNVRKGMPYILGLTGNIASGKTTVGLLLLELGAGIYIDADRVVHELYLPGGPLAGRLAGAFGQQIIDEMGGVDRKALGEIVFADPEKLRLLESLVHPEVRDALMSSLANLAATGPETIGVLDAIKLVESGYAQLCQSVWLVTCSEEVQLRRLVEQRGMSEAEARLRLAAQPSLEAKRSAAGEIIDNSGDVEHLRQQVTAAWTRFITSIEFRQASPDR
jgi:dephospho-CoA kinase